MSGARIEVWSKESINGDRKVFFLEGKDKGPIPFSELEKWSKEIFSNPVLEDFSFEEESLPGEFFEEVHFLPGVTDNQAQSATEALGLLSEYARKYDVKVYSGALLIDKKAKFNPLLQKCTQYTKKEMEARNRFFDISIPKVKLDEDLISKEINLDTSLEELLELNQKNCWALGKEDLIVIKEHYNKLGRMPTDVEIEVIAQTWSEHCKHRIFKAKIYMNDGNKEYTIDGPKPYS